MTSPAPDSSAYSPGFYDYIEAGARRSAECILPLVAAAIGPASVLDVGCGRGIWLAVWQDLGVKDVLGLDGDYIAPERLAIGRDRFRATNIAAPFDPGRRWDLVQCLEVAEHIPPASSEQLVRNLVGQGDVILFSAAVPGQGGHDHINERPLDDWRELFAREGYRAFDLVRPRVRDDRDVDAWYRFNTLLYVHERAVSRLSAETQRTALDPAQPVPDVAPWSWRLRRAVLRPLPAAWITALARLKNRVLRSS
jgi:SAM-dependent methyltransferase